MIRLLWKFDKSPKMVALVMFPLKTNAAYIELPCIFILSWIWTCRLDSLFLIPVITNCHKNCLVYLRLVLVICIYLCLRCAINIWILTKFFLDFRTRCLWEQLLCLDVSLAACLVSVGNHETPRVSYSASLANAGTSGKATPTLSIAPPPTPNKATTLLLTELLNTVISNHKLPLPMFKKVVI